MSKSPGKQAAKIAGERAIASDLPIFVLQLDGRWVPGNEHTRARGQRLIELGYGYATWVYGVDAAAYNASQERK